MVDLDPKAMYANNISAIDVSNAISAQNLILPAGERRWETAIISSGSTAVPPRFRASTICPSRSATAMLSISKMWAQVRDGYSVQTNIVRENGRRGVLLTVLKNGQASTLDIVAGIKRRCPLLCGPASRARSQPMFDQSIFCAGRHYGVVREALIAGRPHCVDDPAFSRQLAEHLHRLYFDTSCHSDVLHHLGAMGHTINSMTLGGMALAVGILVDDATVEIENVHRNMGMAKPLTARFWMARGRLPYPHSFPRWPSVLYLCPWFCSPAREVSFHAAGAGGGFRHADVLLSVPHHRSHDDASSAGPEVEIYAHGEEGLSHAQDRSGRSTTPLIHSSKRCARTTPKRSAGACITGPESRAFIAYLWDCRCC